MNSIEQFEKEYPTIAAELKALQQKKYETFAKKMLSYGLGNIAVGSTLDNDQEINFALKGLWFRKNDKLQRLRQLVVMGKDNPLDDEPVDDAYLDLGLYSDISILVKSGKWKK